MLLMVKERGAPTAQVIETARCLWRNPGREWGAEEVRRVFESSQGADIAPREKNRGEAEQEGKPTGIGATGIASCLHPRGYHKHGHDLESETIERRGVIRNKEIAAPKDGDLHFTLLSESFWRF
jgi:hypothetical protein